MPDSARRKRYRLPRLLARLFAIDLRALGIFRILLALLVIIDFCGRWLDIDAHYTDLGIVPRDVAFRFNGNTYWTYVSPYMWFGDRASVAVLIGISLLATVCLLIGYRTRMASIVSWFLLIGIQTRNPMILHGADMELRLLLFWGMFLPLGARFSVDGLAACHLACGRPRPKRIFSFGSAGMLLQVAAMYWFTAALKTGASWRQDFTALYYALSIETYATPVGQWLLYRMGWVLKPLTALTMVLELGGPTLAFSPVATGRIRTWLAGLFLVFHLVILNLTFDLGPFPYTAALPWLLFLPSPIWDRLTRAWNRLPSHPIKNGIEQNRERLITLRNRGIARRAERGRLTAPRLRLNPLAQAAAAAALLLVLLFNLRSLEQPAFFARLLPPTPAALIWTTRLDQQWMMFAPTPMQDDGWFVAVARTYDGTEFDILTNRAPVSWEKPPVLSHIYPSERWRKYKMSLWIGYNDWQRPYFCRWLTREWDRTHHGPAAIRAIDLYYMMNKTQPDYQKPLRQKVLLWSYDASTDPALMKEE